jgi:hypothetical protein
MRRHQVEVQGKAGLDLSTDRDEAPADRAPWERSVRAGNDAKRTSPLQEGAGHDR